MSEPYTIGFAMTGSFCTYGKIVPILKALTELYRIVPIMSYNAYQSDTRFGNAKEFIEEIQDACGCSILHTLQQVEPIGPKKLLDLLVVAPCTGNTIAKLASAISDTPVSLACKSHLRNNRPILLGVYTNDGLSASAENIGKLLARKNIYFIPFGQDDPVGKPNSLVADWSVLPRAIEFALNCTQLQPILLPS